MARLDAPSAHADPRRRPLATGHDVADWRRASKQIYREARSAAQKGGPATAPGAARPAVFSGDHPDPLVEEDLAVAARHRQQEAERAASVQAAATARHKRIFQAGRLDHGLPAQPPHQHRGAFDPIRPPTSGPRYFSTGPSFVLAESDLPEQPAKRRRRQKRDESLASGWALLETDCSLPTDGFSPSHALYVAMVCQARQEMTPAHMAPPAGAAHLFERAVSEPAAKSTRGSRAAAAQPRTAAGAPASSAHSATHTASSRLQTSTKPKHLPAVTPVMQPVVTSGLTPSQAEQARRAALQSYVDSAFGAAASRLNNPSSSVSSAAASGSTAAAAASGGDQNLARIIAPAVIVPVVVIAAAIIAGLCLWRRRKRRNGAVPLSGRATPGGRGPISHPRPLMATAGQGTSGVGQAHGGSSQDSLGTTPSAIGVAFSEPRTPWGRRSLVDVLAGGVRGASSSPSKSSPGHERVLSTSSSFAGRQPSLKNSSSIPSELRGVGGYNVFAYQPGQPRPVVTSPGGHYEPYGPASIVPVPESAQRHSSEEGSISGYSGEGEGGGTGASATGSAESYTARLAPPIADVGYAHLAQAQRSRLTQRTSEGEQGYCTADVGLSSTNGGHAGEEAEHLSESAHGNSSPIEEAVNFGTSPSGSGSGSSGTGRLAGTRPYHSSEDSLHGGGSRTSTPRLGAGHGSVGNRRNDGSGSWWNA
ncbi:hypothetical protein JCM8202v2_000406 [Rhodotorula sphaerocarpa]